MPKFIDLTGQKFGRLIIIERSNNNKSNKITWLCKCDCGNEKIACGGDLKNGRIKSCGCLLRTHGLSKHSLYPIWNQMTQRCSNIKDRYYKNYGGRGITVCKRWMKFENFLTDMGNPPTDQHQIDRINNNKGYSPKNCHWVTPKQQARNTSRNHMITLDEKTKCLQAWADEFDINPSSIRFRLKSGWSIEKALTKPIIERKKK